MALCVFNSVFKLEYKFGGAMNNEYMETIKDNETNYKANLLKI